MNEDNVTFLTYVPEAHDPAPSTTELNAKKRQHFFNFLDAAYNGETKEVNVLTLKLLEFIASEIKDITWQDIISEFCKQEKIVTPWTHSKEEVADLYVEILEELKSTK